MLTVFSQFGQDLPSHEKTCRTLTMHKLFRR